VLGGCKESEVVSDLEEVVNVVVAASVVEISSVVKDDVGGMLLVMTAGSKLRQVLLGDSVMLTTCPSKTSH